MNNNAGQSIISIECCIKDDIEQKLKSINWDFSGINGPDRIHNIHPYPAKFIPQIPRELIRLFHPQDDSIVLDPFCGSGTTLVEAIRAGLPAIGIDVHPLAILIAKTKTTPLKYVFSPLARDMVKKASLESAPIPQIPRVNHWFLSDVQHALANLVHCINQIDDPYLEEIRQRSFLFSKRCFRVWLCFVLAGWLIIGILRLTGVLNVK